MRALHRVALALGALALLSAAPGSAWSNPYVVVDVHYCDPEPEPAACMAYEATHASCTLDLPPSRCGNHVVYGGFGRGA